jgi:hypothetical protein
MHAVHRHAGPLQPTRQLIGEQHIGELGLAVGAAPAEAPVALQVIEVDPAAPKRRRGDVYHPAGRAVLEQLQQQVGEQERAQMVHREGGLEAVGGHAAVVQQDPGAVDQHMQAVVASQEAGCCVPD